jgi:hypothetical protein
MFRFPRGPEYFSLLPTVQTGSPETTQWVTQCKPFSGGLGEWVVELGLWAWVRPLNSHIVRILRIGTASCLIPLPPPYLLCV